MIIRFSLFALPLLSAALVAQTAPPTVKIQDATTVHLSLTQSLSSATNKVDDPVTLEVTEDVKVGDVVAIPKGSTAVGHIIEVEPHRSLGRAGQLNFAIDNVKAPDGSNVRLRASSTRKGEDKTGAVIAGTLLLSPLFLLKRGKDVTIEKGTALTVYVDGDKEISLAPPAASGNAAVSAASPQ
ncbi:MAG: hypothetical protein ABSF54_29620 [Bryobacteraceae bacterium]|jgi:hypothetical protein